MFDYFKRRREEAARAKADAADAAVADQNARVQAAYDGAAQLGALFTKALLAQGPNRDGFSNSVDALVAFATNCYESDPDFRAAWTAVKGDRPSVEHVGWLRLWVPRSPLTSPPEPPQAVRQPTLTGAGRTVAEANAYTMTTQDLAAAAEICELIRAAQHRPEDWESKSSRIRRIGEEANANGGHASMWAICQYVARFAEPKKYAMGSLLDTTWNGVGRWGQEPWRGRVVIPNEFSESGEHGAITQSGLDNIGQAFSRLNGELRQLRMFGYFIDLSAKQAPNGVPGCYVAVMPTGIPSYDPSLVLHMIGPMPLEYDAEIRLRALRQAVEWARTHRS